MKQQFHLPGPFLAGATTSKGTILVPASARTKSGTSGMSDKLSSSLIWTTVKIIRQSLFSRAISPMVRFAGGIKRLVHLIHLARLYTPTNKICRSPWSCPARISAPILLTPHFLPACMGVAPSVITVSFPPVPMGQSASRGVVDAAQRRCRVTS